MTMMGESEREGKVSKVHKLVRKSDAVKTNRSHAACTRLYLVYVNDTLGINLNSQDVCDVCICCGHIKLA